MRVHRYVNYCGHPSQSWWVKGDEVILNKLQSSEADMKPWSKRGDMSSRTSVFFPQDGSWRSGKWSSRSTSLKNNPLGPVIRAHPRELRSETEGDWPFCIFSSQPRGWRRSFTMFAFFRHSYTGPLLPRLLDKHRANAHYET